LILASGLTPIIALLVSSIPAQAGYSRVHNGSRPLTILGGSRETGIKIITKRKAKAQTQKTATPALPTNFKEAEIKGVGDNSKEVRAIIIKALEVGEENLKSLMPSIVEDSSTVDDTMLINANAVSLVLRPIIINRVAYNAIVIADDKLPLDNGALRQYVYKTCLGGARPDGSSALYKAIERGVMLAAMPVIHSHEVFPTYVTKDIKGLDEKGKEVTHQEIVTDEEGNPTEDGGITAPRLYVHKKTKEKNEKNTWVLVDETREDQVNVPLGKCLSDVNRHYNPPAPRGTKDGDTWPDGSTKSGDNGSDAASLVMTKDGMTFKHVLDRINGTMTGSPTLKTLSANGLNNIRDLLLAVKVFKSEAITLKFPGTIEYLEHLAGSAEEREADEDPPSVAA
jgi:hypothetical protein